MLTEARRQDLYPKLSEGTNLHIEREKKKGSSRVDYELNPVNGVSRPKRRRNDEKKHAVKSTAVNRHLHFHLYRRPPQP
ncbi:hypothetical protein L6452_02379 [Arctium lappa]|uniref:Uncharacterized protein n=1 Tax=Arctium lappa TaxID=4217 RepID=A0ACB9FK87_ARCLA|nr:hypothetical protein L6452_02379 [Arctium lappa]